MTERNTCFIWTDSPASCEYLRYVGNGLWTVDSPRAGGRYCFDVESGGTIKGLDEGVKARLTTLLVDMRRQNDEPKITPELVERAWRARPLEVDERAVRLLRFIERQSKMIGDYVRLDSRAPTEASFMQAMAWSESTSESEVQYLLNFLLSEQQRWIGGFSLSGEYRVTVEGYRRLAEAKTNLDSGQAFVAMWFGDEMNAAYEKGIEPAIVNAGYKPMRIDRKQDVVKIDDEIIAEIRRSRFLVADFTHEKNGARGGVYFEAGFAFGLSIPVIYLCRKDKIDNIHFDTRQYHHITWGSPEDLCERLTKRILALIGEGPDRSGVAP